jgi:imidazolonepropionase-like amidohydrolase
LLIKQGHKDRRISEMMAMRDSPRTCRQFVLFLAIFWGFCGLASAQDYEIQAPGLDPLASTATEGATLFQNVRIFDGKGSELSPTSNVLVRGNKIERISVDTIDVGGNVRTIAGNGRVLMPSLIDAHWHAFMAATPQHVIIMAEPSYLDHRAAQEAEATLMRGFTTIRDLGGPVFGLKQAIDEGIVAGPRIYPSGALISQTSGHGDFRFLAELPRQPGGPLSFSEREGMAAIADSPDEVRLRVREQLRNGASQIKLMGGGGVSSPHNPIESTQFTEAELRAAVEAAADWGTYVTVHAYTPHAVRRAIAAGAKCIEHAQLIDDATAQLMAEKGIWWSLQPLTYDEEVFANMSPFSQQKALEVFAGTENAYRMAKKYNIKTVFGADILFNPGAVRRQGNYLAMLARWMTPAEALRTATANAGELLALSGFINPYPDKLGVVEEGALADLILVDGNPLENLDLVADANRTFKIIMKDGRIYKNTLPDSRK